MNLIFCIVVFEVLLVCYGQSSNRHMICKDVESAFSERSEMASHSRRLQGPPGMKGLSGIKGERGSTGMPGQSEIVDYDRLNEIIEAKVNAGISKLKSRMETIENHLNSTETKVEQEETISGYECSRTYDGFIYDGKCYWGEVHTRKDTNLFRGKQLCTNKHSTLADIYTKEHFDLTMLLLRSKIGSLTTAVIWTAMTKKFEDPDAYLSNGEKAEYTMVRSASGDFWSNAHSRRTQVYLNIRPSPGYTDQGMGALMPGYNARGMLCRVQFS